MSDSYVIKAKVEDATAERFVFSALKTMYRGKHIASGDVAYIFASDHEGGRGLCARGVVTFAESVPRVPGIVRQTPRVNVRVKRTGLAREPVGRVELRAFTDRSDGGPESELNFKFYRQATNKVGRVSPAAAAFLDGFFSGER